ncbi:tetratricopeptide repeat-containing sensor histidine kinase [Lentimicrobium sp. S6]|uniref:tetratricopeptide repeat-containing sensor histidine kinase n=1 Tax=Lentimicrobium sp. S6 TaxID=2735872 RepID=UPI0015547DA2|nr:tetratricopeptide repeat-containing sensor histidine kinase [Lentimicrobium sp. S6]NPD43996.1 tetratricopeptide repeat-containing sensor histidine kinase [Lentimicrobium sp. S6]
MKKYLSFISVIFLFSYAYSKDSMPPQHADSLIEVLESRSTKDTIRAELLNDIGFETYTTDLELTKKYAVELLELSKEINYEVGIVNGYNLLGIYYDYTGDYNEALEQYGMSLRKAEQIHSMSGVSAGLNNLGTIYEILGQYPQALNYYQRSLDIDFEREDLKGVANSYLNIGNLYENLHDNEKAMAYYQKCLILSDSVGFKKLMAYSLLNIGYLYNSSQEYEKAREYYKRSIKISEDNDQQEGVLLACMMMGILDKEEGKHSTAKTNLNRALEISIKLGSISQERYCYFHLADVNFNQGKYKEALKLVKLSYVEDEDSDKNLRMNASELLSSIYAAAKDFDKAYKYHVIFKSLQDDLFNEKNIQETVNLEYRYKYENEKQALVLEQEKKDAINQVEQNRQRAALYFLIIISLLLALISIFILYSLRQRRTANQLLREQKKELEEVNQLLVKQKMEIEAVAKELEKANETKDKFFSIIAHDLRSPFTTILGFSNILLESHEEFDKESLETFLGKIKKGSETALILLENLFSWARSNAGGIKFSPKSLELEPLVNRVCRLYDSGANSKLITLICEVPPESKVYADEEMLRTIIRNLISNAIKFTQEGGEIKISVKVEEAYTKLHVTDNGIGMRQEQVEYLFELNKKTVTRGTSGEKGTGLGLVLCYEFAHRHGGRIEVESKEGEGTEVIVILQN